MKTLGRRNFLRGMGSSMLALPWMESLARGASGMVSPQRAAFYYVPIGVVRQTFFPGEDNGVVPKFNNENLLKVNGIKWKNLYKMKMRKKYYI